MADNPPIGAIFDFDGVLADSVPLIVEVLGATIKSSLGIDLPPHVLRRAVGPPLAMVIEELCRQPGIEPTDAALAEIVAAFRLEYGLRAPDETQMFPGIPEALSDVRQFASMTICSSKPRPMVEAILKSWGIERLFDDIEAPLPSQSEPKAVGLRRLLARTAASPDRCVLIGDTAFDGVAAMSENVHFLGVAWGVDDSATLQECGAVAVADSPAALPFEITAIVNP